MRLIFIFATKVFAQGDGSTDVADALNDQMRASNDGDFSSSGGKGIIIRSPDFFSADAPLVPATFWHNDIYAPSSMYPTGNAWCPLAPDKRDGWIDASFMDCMGQENGPWDYAIVGVVVGSGMWDLFQDFDQIQDYDWGWGVFYPTDSNSVDKRCLYFDQGSDSGWDCPGGWVNMDGDFWRDSGKKGSGNYHMGNVYAGLEGGGSGCHFDTNDNVIDQDNAHVNDLNIVSDYYCQCEYAFNDDWSHWVYTWMDNRENVQAESWRGWLAGGRANAPQWAVDVSACWMNNPRDMIHLQNEMYWARDQWLNYKAPYWASWQGDEDKERKYWGWNEIPVSQDILGHAENWDCLMVKLPANLCQDGGWGGSDSPNCLSDAAQKQLEKDLEQRENDGKIVPGEDNMGNRPGSYMLFVREYAVSGKGWNRWFFCDNFYGPNRKKKIVYYSKEDYWGNGACFYDNYNGVV